MIGLNVGSGQRRFESVPGVIEWINIDSVQREGMLVDLIADGAHLPEAWAGTVDYFVLSHTCEHFQCGESVGLIREAQRVLKPRGSLIVTVPDLRALAIRWLEGGLSTQLYMTNIYGAYMGSPEDTHKWGFDRESLKEFLWSSSAWTVMLPFDWRTVPGMDLAKDFWILGVECVK